MTMTEKEYEALAYVFWDLRDDLYAQEGCTCGGPLHIILDDGNVRDSDLELCGTWTAQEAPPIHVQALSVAILTCLEVLNEAQRAVLVCGQIMDPPYVRLSLRDQIGMAGRYMSTGEVLMYLEDHSLEDLEALEKRP